MRVREEKEVGEREKDVRGSEGGRREREVREREREREWKEILLETEACRRKEEFLAHSKNFKRLC